MKSHRRKMIAPIVICIIMVAYYVAYFGVLIVLLHGAWKYIFGVFPLACIFLIIKVCVERIKEIRKGEEDDIGQY